jgi:hypothetical protein
MNLRDKIRKLDDDDLIALLDVLRCPAGQEEKIYFKSRAAGRLREGINARQAESSQKAAAAGGEK